MFTSINLANITYIRTVKQRPYVDYQFMKYAAACLRKFTKLLIIDKVATKGALEKNTDMVFKVKSKNLHKSVEILSLPLSNSNMLLVCIFAIF